jgi:hypothetical protein
MVASGPILLFQASPPASAVMNLLLRSLLFSIGMIVSSRSWPRWWYCAFHFPLSYRYRISQLWTKFNIWWLRVTCGSIISLSGVEHIPDRPAIVMAKHQSTWETLFLHQYLPPLAWVVKRELLWLPLFRLGAGLAATDRDQPPDRRLGGQASHPARVWNIYAKVSGC